VQALCGIVLPMTTLFLLMLCNDRDVLGPWANGPWLKAFASVIVGVLILLSVVLTVTTLFPRVDVTALFLTGACVVAVALAALGVTTWWRERGGRAVTVLQAGPSVAKELWTMPPATLLTRPRYSLARRSAMLALGGYMVVALVMLIVKSVELAGG
jgi:hypothetical protein